MLTNSLKSDGAPGTVNVVGLVVATHQCSHPFAIRVKTPTSIDVIPTFS